MRWESWWLWFNPSAGEGARFAQRRGVCSFCWRCSPCWRWWLQPYRGFYWHNSLTSVSWLWSAKDEFHRLRRQSTSYGMNYLNVSHLKDKLSFYSFRISTNHCPSCPEEMMLSCMLRLGFQPKFGEVSVFCFAFLTFFSGFMRKKKTGLMSFWTHKVLCFFCSVFTVFSDQPG